MADFVQVGGAKINAEQFTAGMGADLIANAEEVVNAAREKRKPVLKSVPSGLEARPDGGGFYFHGTRVAYGDYLVPGPDNTGRAIAKADFEATYEPAKK